MWWIVSKLIAVCFIFSSITSCTSANALGDSEVVLDIDTKYLHELAKLGGKDVSTYRQSNSEFPLILDYMLESDDLNSIVLNRYESLGGNYDLVANYINALCQESKIQALKVAFAKGVKIEPVTSKNLIGIPAHCLILSIDQANFELFELLLFEGRNQHGDNFVKVDLLPYIENKISIATGKSNE